MVLTIGGRDVAQLAASITTAGSEKECARTLTADIVQSPTDSNIPTVAISVGAAARFAADGQDFSGIVTSVSRSTASSAVTVTAKDMGLYLKRNKIVQKIKGMTAEAAAAAICGQYGIGVGSLAPTGYTFDRYFMGVTLYDAIMTGYALAAAQNGRAYMLRMRGSSVEIIEKGAMLAGVVEEGSNLMEASYSETGDSIVSQVAIYDKQGNLKQTVTGDMTLGVMQEIIIESSARAESIAAAEELIRKNGLKRSGTVTNLGNAQCIAGNSVLIYESFTGLYGKFFIASDNHSWKNGIYTNKLTLAWETTMDATAAGEALSAGKAASSGTASNSPFDYLYNRDGTPHGGA